MKVNQFNSLQSKDSLDIQNATNIFHLSEENHSSSENCKTLSDMKNENPKENNNEMNLDDSQILNNYLNSLVQENIPYFNENKLTCEVIKKWCLLVIEYHSIKKLNKNCKDYFTYFCSYSRKLCQFLNDVDISMMRSLCDGDFPLNNPEILKQLHVHVFQERNIQLKHQDCELYNHDDTLSVEFILSHWICTLIQVLQHRFAFETYTVWDMVVASMKEDIWHNTFSSEDIELAVSSTIDDLKSTDKSPKSQSTGIKLQTQRSASNLMKHVQKVLSPIGNTESKTDSREINSNIEIESSSTEISRNSRDTMLIQNNGKNCENSHNTHEVNHGNKQGERNEGKISHLNHEKIFSRNALDHLHRIVIQLDTSSYSDSKKIYVLIAKCLRTQMLHDLFHQIIRSQIPEKYYFKDAIIRHSEYKEHFLCLIASLSSFPIPLTTEPIEDTHGYLDFDNDD